MRSRIDTTGYTCTLAYTNGKMNWGRMTCKSQVDFLKVFKYKSSITIVGNITITMNELRNITLNMTVNITL